jgi:hypothetical protein
MIHQTGSIEYLVLAVKGEATLKLGGLVIGCNQFINLLCAEVMDAWKSLS